MKNAISLLELLAIIFSVLHSPFTFGVSAATQYDMIGPAGSGSFGTSVTALPNGNVVVTDPFWDPPGAIPYVGAVYLYSGANGTRQKFIADSTTCIASVPAV